MAYSCSAVWPTIHSSNSIWRSLARKAGSTPVRRFPACRARVASSVRIWNGRRALSSSMLVQHLADTCRRERHPRIGLRKWLAVASAVAVAAARRLRYRCQSHRTHPGRTRVRPRLTPELHRCRYPARALLRDDFDVIVIPACIQYFADPAALVIRLLAQLRNGGELHILDGLALRCSVPALDVLDPP